MNILNFVQANAKTLMKTALVGGVAIVAGIGVKKLLKRETGLPEGYDECVEEAEDSEEN